MQKYYAPITPTSGGIHSQPRTLTNDGIIDIERASEFAPGLVYFDLRNSLDATDLIPTGSVRGIDYSDFTCGRAVAPRG